MGFRDHFSEDSNGYSEYWPRYPADLFLHLSSLCNHHDLAWDCVAGSGQAAISLVDQFHKVWVTDASASQIKNAVAKRG